MRVKCSILPHSRFRAHLSLFVTFAVLSIGIPIESTVRCDGLRDVMQSPMERVPKVEGYRTKFKKDLDRTKLP